MEGTGILSYYVAILHIYWAKLIITVPVTALAPNRAGPTTGTCENIELYI